MGTTEIAELSRKYKLRSYIYEVIVDKLIEETLKSYINYTWIYDPPTTTTRCYPIGLVTLYNICIQLHIASSQFKITFAAEKCHDKVLESIKAQVGDFDLNIIFLLVCNEPCKIYRWSKASSPVKISNQ